MNYLIDPETVKKNAYLPVKIAELSHRNPDAALEIVRDWGEGKKPVLHLWDEVIDLLDSDKDKSQAI